MSWFGKSDVEKKLDLLLEYFRGFTNAKINKLEVRLNDVYYRSGYIMGSIAEVKEAVQKLKAFVAAETGEVAAKVSALETKVAELKATLDAGTTVTKEDLDGVLADLNDITARVSNIIPNVPAEDPAPVVAVDPNTAPGT